MGEQESSLGGSNHGKLLDKPLEPILNQFPTVTSSSKVASGTEEPALVENSSISDFTAGNNHENLDASESVKVAEACTEPCNDHHEEEFQAVLSHENDEVPDVQPVDYAEEYTEPVDSKRLAKLNTWDDDTESKSGPRKLNDLPGSSGSLDPEGFSESKLTTDTDDGTHGESNVEADDDAQNKTISKSTISDMHHESSKGSGLPEG
ncbi:hypothetical protein Acr_06g0007950 [Actinidia rufa]|uniref:Uncharacterized protein n=1 Tax=Actinidia rufa TaxID=165716 RepID=A0A7J0EQT8_9ERIC|nr:hypothetical protein Acr_06g0007950 [Actinidia rufa]